ncbi:MAG: carbohydrate ABC transporter permease [Eubacteriales bacterium]
MVKNKNILQKIVAYIFLSVLGIVMIYPLLWMLASSFKETSDIFNSISIIPPTLDIQYYIEGWKGVGEYTFATFFKNTFILVIPATIFTVISCSIVAYGFARFEFPLKKILFTAMLATLMLPSSVLIIPRYLLFRDLQWLNTYLPFIVPAMFAGNSFFIFQLIQFFRGIPKELDEAASIDGCSTWRIYTDILMPLCKPALISVALFNFIWGWNAFFEPLIYISSVNKYPLSLALRMTLDLGSAAAWNEIFAMSVLSIAPPIIIFFCAQDYFIEGISSSGLKG